MRKLWSLIFLMIIFVAPSLFAQNSGHEESMVHLMNNLVFQIAVIVFAARAGGMLFKKIKMPAVLGELVAGIVIGPYVLGHLPLPGFEHGLFPLHPGAMPVSPELYGIATIASIILLFLAGLETDIELFLRYSFAGTVVGIGGILASFFIGTYTGVLFLDLSFMDPKALFLGIMSTATSVGITARILSERRSMDSPEGVTILAGAVIDDVLGIIMLAVVLGIATVMKTGGSSGELPWGSIGLIALKAVGVWLGFTIIGLLSAHKLSSWLKKFKNKNIITIMAFGMALFLAGIFEKVGLAMIIGAYVMGLSLSKTDLSYVIQEVLYPLQVFFVPLFFTVMGMMVNVHVFFQKEILIFGLIYSIGAVFAKMAGCGLPSLFLNFNKLGATRIGLGMVPRGEVALIIAGIGLSTGILDENIFGVSIMMTLFTTIPAPPLLDMALRKKSKGTRKDEKKSEVVKTTYDFPSPEMTDLLVNHVLQYFSSEGFYVHMMEFDHKVYQVRKDQIFIKFERFENKLVFNTRESDVTFIKTIVYEAFIKLYYIIERVKTIAIPEDMRKDLVTTNSVCKPGALIPRLVDPRCVKMHLEANTKKEVIKELVEILLKNNKINNKNVVIEEVLSRENIISTGMEHGVALPHARTEGVAHVELAIGLKPEGIDFNSIDGKPSKVFCLILSSTEDNDPHIQVLAEFATSLHDQEAVDFILNSKDEEEVIGFFCHGAPSRKFLTNR